MKRIDIFLGTKCNNNCIFCISKPDSLNEELSLDDAKINLLNGFNDGCREVHFTGSEPTIRSDFLKIISLAKQIGFEKIKITTNGRMFSYPSFCKRSVASGLTGIIFSLHGHISSLHDSLTCTKGSFNELISGIKNIKKYNLVMETNTTIVKQNLNYLSDIADLLVSFNLNSSELIYVHPQGNAYINYNKIVPSLSELDVPLQKAIQIGAKNNKLILSRYVPYCHLGKFVKYASENYEPLEVEQIGTGFFTKDARKDRQNLGMKKALKCVICKYYLVCMGVHKEHNVKNDEFVPVAGSNIKTRDELLNG
ncbi:MAG: radical SAM protein [archaeon]